MADHHDLDDEDILCAEPLASSRPVLRRRYTSTGEFVTIYLELRDGEPLAFATRRRFEPGELVDLELDVEDELVMLHGQVLDGDGARVRVQAITGRFTDRLVSRLFRERRQPLRRHR